jgi:multiple sugar transport system substrate-binding protein
MDERTSLSRRKLLHTLTGAGVIAAADLAWWDAPLIGARKAWGAEPVRFQWSVPEPTRIALMNSLAERFNQSQKDFAVAIEYVPQAQARQKLISAIASGSPPDLCQVWDNWVGQFNGMGAVEDITVRAKSWKHYADVAPTAWQTVTINDQVVSLPLSVTLDGIYYRTDRLKELGLKEPTPDWTWDEFLSLAKAFTKADKNQYGYGMRGGGTWALLYPSEFAYANGAEVLKDGKVVINSKEAVDALAWYLDLALKHKVTPPSAATDGSSRSSRLSAVVSPACTSTIPAPAASRRRTSAPTILRRCRCRSVPRTSAPRSGSPRRSPCSRAPRTRKAPGRS